MTGLERTVAEILAVIFLIGGFALWERHKGAVSCEDHDKSAVVAQEAHNAQVTKTDTQIINQEAIDHAKALSVVPDPTPILSCVRYYTTRPLPKTPAAQSGGDAAPALPSATGPSFDPAPAIGRIGEAADAQVAELQAYIRDVCLSK